MRKILLSTCATLIILGQNAYAENMDELNQGNVTIVQSPEGYRYANVSKTDVNRLFCENGEFGEITFASEKEIDIQRVGKNAFLKLTPINEMQGDTILNTTISDFTREAYVTCDNQMFSLVFVPKDIAAQTVILKTPTTQKHKLEQKTQIINDYQTTISNLIKNAYKEQMPDEYEFMLIDKIDKEFNELSLIKFKEYKGDIFNLTEYLILAKDNALVNEKMFLPYVKKPLAIAIDSFNLKKDSTTRMFVVSSSTDNADSIQSSGKYSNVIETINNKKENTQPKQEINKEIIDFALQDNTNSNTKEHK